MGHPPSNPFLPGYDPRRGRGPARGLASWIEARTNGGLELAEFYLSVARGEPQVVPLTVKLDGVEYDVEIEGGSRVVIPDLETRLSCARWLTDRCFGKVPERVAVTDTEGNDVFDPRTLDGAALGGLACFVAGVASRPAKALPADAGDRGRADEEVVPAVHPEGVADR